MNLFSRISSVLRLSFLCLVASASMIATADAQWTPPTPEELSMTSQPEVPGAAAVYLFREEITEDNLHMWSKYVRLKVLTEKGKEYANVEVRQYEVSDGGGYTINNVEGRTIHADGTVIPFTGKPFEKLIEKGQGFREMAKIFTLPDVQVGSIIEYRYKLRYDDNWYKAPDWFVQSELYTRKGHYLWKPTDKELVSKNDRGEQLTSVVAWDAILPKGMAVKQTRLPPSSAFQNGQAIIELDAHDVTPQPEEEYMPPIGSLSYRVLFYYSPYRTVDEYWKNEGKSWAKMQDRFIGPGGKVSAAARELTAGAATDTDKLHKLYAAVMKLDNTTYSRRQSAAEEKARGLNPAKSTDDIWDRQRGNDDQIAELFVALARASGFKAGAMLVTNRDRSIFLPSYLSFGQLNDVIAIVNVDGKDQFFDPGQRFCQFGHLAWKHSMTRGLRQVDNGSAFEQTPAESASFSRVQRVANLTMDAHGEVTGTVKMTWTGAGALNWRQRSTRGDETSLRNDLRTGVERLLPHGMDVKVDTITNLEDFEQPLIVTYNVKGGIASSTGKRLLLPGDIFEANSTSTFPHEKRVLPIYFNYPHVVQDAVRINFPDTLALESVPTGQKLPYQKFAYYSLASESTSTSYTVRREFDLGNIIYSPEEYSDLRTFYNKLETKDQESAVLKAAASPAGN